jgi:hypothetical protein
MSILNIIIGGILGFGAMQELIVRGIIDREIQPAILGSLSAISSVLLIAAGVAMLKEWPSAHILTIWAGLSVIAVHVWGAMPPHHNVGIPAFLLGVGYGMSLLAVHALRRRSRQMPVRS